MIGILVRDRYKIWSVKYKDIDNSDKQLPLISEDVEYLLELERNFDNLDSRIDVNPEVEFFIVENKKMSGIVKYAKLM